MIRLKIILRFLCSCIAGSCNKYLDIVPDKTQELELLFERQEAAYKALATCYEYLPMDDAVYASMPLHPTELTTPIAQETPGVEMMRGKQSSSDPLMGYWGRTLRPRPQPGIALESHPRLQHFYQPY